MQLACGMWSRGMRHVACSHVAYLVRADDEGEVVGAAKLVGDVGPKPDGRHVMCTEAGHVTHRGGT
eukprot:3453906-Prymnesium_polylepis.1